MALPADEPLEVSVKPRAEPSEEETKPKRSPETKTVIARGNMIGSACLDLVCMLALVYLNALLHWALGFIPNAEHTPGIGFIETLSWIATDATAATIILRDVWNSIRYLWGRGER